MSIKQAIPTANAVPASRQEYSKKSYRLGQCFKLFGHCPKGMHFGTCLHAGVNFGTQAGGGVAIKK